MDDGSLRSTAKDARRQAIVDIARTIFLEGGFTATSMSTIAATLGGSKGTLYNYFPSKESLFAAVIQDHCERKQAMMFDGLNTQGGGDVALALQELGERYAAIVLGDDSIAFSRVTVAESIRFPEIGRALFEAGMRRGGARMASFLEAEIKAGRLRPCDPRRAAEQFCELCLAGLYRQRLWNIIPKPSPGEIRANVRAALDVFLAAYGVQAPATAPPTP